MKAPGEKKHPLRRAALVLVIGSYAFVGAALAHAPAWFGWGAVICGVIGLVLSFVGDRLEDAGRRGR